MEKIEIPQNEVDGLFNKLTLRDNKRGYFLNHNTDMAKGLVKALLKNEKRYGYQLCPCRLSAGSRENDLDAICPCDYRDADLNEYGVCYCGLYVTKKVFDEKIPTKPVPERRPKKEIRINQKNMENEKIAEGKLPLPVWRCRVCGYICAREDAPDICPICGATHDRFVKFMK